jgi:DNA-directed RNA polymerase specialized sigma24 family protein
MISKKGIKPADFNSGEKIRFILNTKPREFKYYYKKYEPAINLYAKRLSYLINKPSDFDDLKQEAYIKLWELYKSRVNLYNFQPELNKYKKLLKKAKEKKLIDGFTVGKDYPYRDSPDTLIFATAWTRWVLNNSIKDYRRRNEKTIVAGQARHVINIHALEDHVIDRIDKENILNGIKNQNIKKSYMYWKQGYLQTEIAEMLKISKQAVNKNIKSVEKLIKSYYEEK